MSPSRLVLAAYLVLLTGCDITKKIFQSKESTKTESSNESTQLTRTQIDSNWSRIGSSLFHRNGSVWIEFDSLSRIDYRPGQGFSAIGYNARLHGNLATTLKDTTAELSSSTSRIQKDTTSRQTKEEEKKVLKKEKDKEQKSQRIAPILVLSIVAIIALLYAAKQFKLF